MFYCASHCTYWTSFAMLSSHWCNWKRSCWSSSQFALVFIVLNDFVSSLYLATTLLTSNSRLFMYKLNSANPSIDACRIPLFIFCHLLTHSLLVHSMWELENAFTPLLIAVLLGEPTKLFNSCIERCFVFISFCFMPFIFSHKEWDCFNFWLNLSWISCLLKRLDVIFLDEKNTNLFNQALILLIWFKCHISIELFRKLLRTQLRFTGAKYLYGKVQNSPAELKRRIAL